jgi:ribose 1,5-bisphosphokinase
MSGTWIFICGASGVGKDSVIALAQQSLAEQNFAKRTEIIFARRIVTRELQTGSDHDPMTQSQFLALRGAGGLQWHWQAHGFFYGIATHYAADVRAGRLVVVNGSRAHVLGLPPSSNVRLVQITADPQRLAERLAQRGRDATRAVANRLARNGRFSDMKADCVIRNDADLSVAANALANYLKELTPIP